MKQMRKHNLPESGKMQCAQYFYNFLNPNASAEAIFAAKQLADMHGVNVCELMILTKFVRWMRERGHPEFKDVLPWNSEEKDGDGGLKFIMDLINMVAQREGIGNILAEGMPRAAEHFGVIDELLSGENGGGEKVSYCMHGMQNHYDPRVFGTSYGLQWLMDNRDPNRHLVTGIIYGDCNNFEVSRQPI